MKLHKRQYGMFFFANFFAIIVAVMNVIQPLLSEQIINSVTERRIQKVIPLVIGYFISIIIVILFEMLKKKASVKYLMDLEHTFRNQITAYILTRKPENYTKKTPQEYISLMNNDIPTIVEDYYGEMNNIIFQVFSIFLSIFALSSIHFVFVLITIVSSIFIVMIPFVFKNTLQKRKNESLNRMAEYNNKLGDAFFGYTTIQSYQIIDKIKNICIKSSEKYMKDTCKYEYLTAWSQVLMGLCSMFSSFAFIVWGSYQIYQKQITIGGLFAAIQLSEQLVIPILGIAHSLNAILAVRGVKEKLTKEYYIEEEKIGQDLGQEINSIDFENVSLSYGKQLIIKNFNYHFEKGKKYLMIGENGSGKSTILRMITGFINENNAKIEGKILINNQEKKVFSRETIFRNLAVVEQEPYIFTGSVEENITLYGMMKVEKFPQLLTILCGDNLVTALKEKRGISNYDTKISGGEKQKIAIARALVKKSNWILLDEATSAMDPESRKIIEKLLLEQEDLTVISISHNYNDEVISKYDEIIRIDNM